MEITVVVSVFIIAVTPIISTQTCTLGSTSLQKSSPNPTPGLFIQQEDRAPCSGVITQWTVCYYDPSAFTNIKHFQILLEVWRNESLRFLNKVGSNIVIINVPDQPEDFQCVNITIDSNQQITVIQGDYIGVYLPPILTLPIITSNSGISNSRVFFVRASAIVPTSVVIFGDGKPQATQLLNHAIHVTATIDFNITKAQQLLVTSSDINDTTTKSRMPMNSTLYTSTLSNENNPSSNRKVFYAIVATSTTLGTLITLLPFIIAIIVTLILAKKTISKSSVCLYSGYVDLEERNDVNMSINDSYSVLETTSSRTLNSETNIASYSGNLDLEERNDINMANNASYGVLETISSRTLNSETNIASYRRNLDLEERNDINMANNDSYGVLDTTFSRTLNSEANIASFNSSIHLCSNESYGVINTSTDEDY